MIYIKPFALAVMLLVHGTNASSCDSSNADNLVQQLDHFNSMLVNYASLGTKVLAASATATKVKAGLHLRAAEETAQPHVAAHEGAHSSPKAAYEFHHQHVQPKQTSPAVIQAVHQQPSVQKQQVQLQHQSQKVEAAPHPSEPAHQMQQPKQQPPKQQQPKQQPKQQQPQKNAAAKEPEHANELQMLIQSSFTQLNSQQKHLNSMSEACIPASHKLKVVSAFSHVFSTYLEQADGLKAAGKLVEVPKSKHSGAKAKNGGAKAKRQQAGWLTMGDDVNGGYNGDMDILTSTTTSTTSSAFQEYGYSNVPYMGQPQFETEYVTVTTTSTSPAPVTSSSGSKKGASDNESDTETGSDTESESSDDESSTGAAAPIPTTTKAHHNIIFSAVDGTFHLVTGSLHLLEHILGIGGHSSSAIAADEQGPKNSHNDKNEQSSDPITNELVGIVGKVARLYDVKR